MTILVAGAAGFIGKHLVRALLDEGHDVLGVDNFITSDPGDLEALLTEPRFSFHRCDIAGPDFPRLSDTLEPAQIYNLACPTGVPNLVPLAYEMLETCYTGSRALLELARRTNAPILLTSSAEVYGNPLVSPQSEDYTGNVDPLGVRGGYEEGKRVAETLFGIYTQRFGVATRIVRVFNTYGPGMSLNETRVIPAFTRSALTGAPLTLHGDGSQVRCHTFISDMVRGLRLAMDRAKPGRAYNLGTAKQTSIRTLAEEIVRLTGSSSPIVSTERPHHDHDTRLPDITRAETELGWAPAIPLAEGLPATVADFRRRLGL